MPAIYNFKAIHKVPSPDEFIDVILSKTQRKTPTVIHPNFAIHRIRRFYMRKVKFTQDNIHNKLTTILEQFPRLDDIHPFYADLIHVLYDRNIYKSALGQLNTCKNLIDAVGRDHLRMLKYTDTLFDSKEVKRSALGRMMTLLKKQSGLEYLEEVRQHLGRLPSIDPNMRTILLAGFPNTGKSSFMNNVTKANSTVKPYAFTTSSLWVGHFRAGPSKLEYQVLDSPGILNKPLNERNTIEMQSITAMAHLQACILFMIDVSEMCGYSIEQQILLLNQIKPLFLNKPVIIGLSKIDLKRFEDLEPRDQQLLKDLANKSGHKMIGLSNITKEGIEKVKEEATTQLLNWRVENKMSKSSRATQDVLSRVYVSYPEQKDNISRPAVIPDRIKENPQDWDEDDMEMELEVDKEREAGYGHYEPDVKQHYKLKNPDHRYDEVPHIMGGKNIADFIDPEIMKKLDALMAEEEERLKKVEGIDWTGEEYYIPEDEREANEQIETKKKKYKTEHQQNKKRSTRAFVPSRYRKKTFEQMTRELAARGVDKATLDKTREHQRELSKRNRSKSRLAGEKDLSKSRTVSEARQVSEARSRTKSILGKRQRSLTNRNRSQSATDRFAGFRDPRLQINAVIKGFKKQKTFQMDGRAGEGDHAIYNWRPKHLLSGKASMKRDRR